MLTTLVFCNANKCGVMRNVTILTLLFIYSSKYTRRLRSAMPK